MWPGQRVAKWGIISFYCDTPSTVCIHEGFSWGRLQELRRDLHFSTRLRLPLTKSTLYSETHTGVLSQTHRMHTQRDTLSSKMHRWMDSWNLLKFYIRAKALSSVRVFIFCACVCVSLVQCDSQLGIIDKGETWSTICSPSISFHKSPFPHLPFPLSLCVCACVRVNTRRESEWTSKY